MTRGGSSVRRLLFGLWALVCLAAMTWPVYDRVANRIEPWILGLPFSLAWVVGWVVLGFFALLLFHVTGEGD